MNIHDVIVLNANLLVAKVNINIPPVFRLLLPSQLLPSPSWDVHLYICPSNMDEHILEIVKPEFSFATWYYLYVCIGLLFIFICMYVCTYMHKVMNIYVWLQVLGAVMTHSGRKALSLTPASSITSILHERRLLTGLSRGTNYSSACHPSPALTSTMGWDTALVTYTTMLIVII